MTKVYRFSVLAGTTPKTWAMRYYIWDSYEQKRVKEYKGLFAELRALFRCWRLNHLWENVE